MTVLQRDNAYVIKTPQGICVAQLFLPPDQQYLMDGKVLQAITKVLAIRWEVTKSSK